MSLKIKLPLVVTLLVLVSAAGVGYFMIRHEQDVLKEEIARRGHIIAQQLSGVDPPNFNGLIIEANKLKVIDTLVFSATAFEAYLAPNPYLYDMAQPLLAALNKTTDSLLVVGGDTLRSWVTYAGFFGWREEEFAPDSFVLSWDSVPILARPEGVANVLGKPSDQFTFVSPILIGTDTLGFAQVRLDPMILDRAIRSALLNVAPIIGGVLGVSILLSLLFSFLFTIPVSRLKRQSLELARGDFTARVKVRSRDELGVLGRVFNKMARNLQRNYEELQDKLVEIKHLFKMATEDDLTGLYVKRYFLDLLAGELRRSIRYDRPLSLLMCDIDHFKLVNDNYGHPAGDKVLHSIARRMVVATREGVDAIGRYGGEEFMVMLPETDEHGAWLVAERLRSVVSSEPISLLGVEGVRAREVAVTISIGVTTMRQDTTLEKMIATADKALYASKQGGRNRSTSLTLEAV